MTIEPIATIEGCYPEKFGIPRQARLVKSAKAKIHLLAPYQSKDFLEGLEHFSHIWLIFGFHHNGWQGDAKVRPQRLGGNQRMGVLATRSPYRPNGLGLSAVEIIAIDYEKVVIEIAGHDLMNGTPIYDIKPYIPFTDAITEATSTFAVSEPDNLPVEIDESANAIFATLSCDTRQLIQEVIAQNPLPPFHHDYDRVYGIAILDLNVRFKRTDRGFIVVSIDKLGYKY